MSSTPSTQALAVRRRRRKRLLVAAAALGLLGGGLWILRANLLERVVTRLARTRAGLDLAFEGLEIEGLSRIRAARVVAVARGDGEVLRHADVHDVEVVLHVRGLWSDEVVVEAVRARSASAEVDLRRAVPHAPSSQPARIEVPTTWPAVSVGALDLDVDAAAGRASVRGARIELGARPGDGSLDLEADSLSLRGADRAAEGALRVRADFDGPTVIVDVATWEGVADVRAARWTPARGGGFDAELELETLVGRADLEAHATEDELRVRGALADVDLASVLRLLGVDADDYGGTWSARGAFVLPIAEPARWSADAEVEAVAARIVGRDADAVAGRFLVTERDYEVRDAAVHAGANSAVVDLLRFPRDGDLGTEFLERATIVLDADLADVQSVLGDAWSIPPEAPPHRVRARAALADRWLQIEHARAEIGASVVDVGTTRFPLGGGARLFLLDPSTEIELGVRAPDSAELARLLLPADVAEHVDVRGAIGGSVRLLPVEDGVRARLTLRARDAAVRGVAIDEVAIGADYVDGVLTIERADVKAGASSIVAKGGVDVRAQRFVALDVEADVPDVRALGRVLGADDLPDGRARLRARFDGPFGAPDGWIEADGTDLVLAGLDVARLRLRARGADGGVAVDDLALDLPLVGATSAAGRLSRDERGAWHADVERLALDALEGSLDLVRPARVTYDAGTVAVDRLELAGGEGALRVSGSRSADSVCADAELDSARVGRVLRAFGVAVPASLRLDGRATVALDGIASDATDGIVDAALRVSVLDLADLDLPRGFRAAGRADAHFAVSGGWRDPVGTIEFTARGLDVRDATGFARLTGAELSARARVGREIEVETFALRIARDARVDVSGTIGVPLDLQRLARGDVGAIGASAVDLSVRADAPDLAPLGVAFDVLRRTEGALTADLAVRGSLSLPAVAGRIRLRDGGVKLSNALPAISGVEVDVALDGDRLAIERAVGTYGGGHVELTGSVALDGAEPALDVGLRGTSVPLLRSAEVSLRTDVDVRVQGRWSALDLRGSAALRDARFEQRLDLERLRGMFESKPGAGGRVLELPAITEAPFDAMRIELDVRSEAPVRVRTPLIRAQVLTSFSIRGTGANPLLEGSLELDGGRIALPASKLDLTRGRVDFDPNDPGRARLDVTAEGRASGYDVSARVTGTTDEPIIELSSIPPATQEDLALLLVAGRVPGTRGLALDEDRVVGEVATYVARDLAYEWFGDAGESFADRLELSTGADVTQSGADTIEVRFRLTGPQRGPGRAVYLRGERDVYDRVNMGVRFVLRTP